MTTYPSDIENRMKAFFDSLSEKDRRRYAAVEATKLGYGGIEYKTKRKATSEFLNEYPIVFDEYLSDLNYTAVPYAYM